MLKTGYLYHGGIMVNYRCNAACRHCLYACSPTRGAGYAGRKTMREICAVLRRGGIGSVHVGGGEPFLNIEGLLMAVRELAAAGISLDYVETNGFWAADVKEARETLRALAGEGVHSLCVSLDPFHAEYVPYGLPLRLAELCDEEGMGYFLWKQQFLRPLSRLTDSSAHSREELEARLRPGYIGDTARSYGVRLGGRAVNIEEEYGPSHSLAELLGGAAKHSPCGDLLSTGHFHVDQDAYFIPPGCTGLRFPLAEAVDGIPAGKYPVFETLYEGGPAALLDFAGDRGFVPEKNYPSLCNLCFHIRAFLSEEGFAELDKNHYEESLKYYSLS
ncbi:MAG: radical SAM protein [Treponema sp.]|jgi:hypothetical protein|nr:radical SAM protein [Treponema sp.]